MSAGKPRPMLFGLVACSSTKLDHAAPAIRLYTSPLFRMSVDYVLRRTNRVLILSAMHGLVTPDQPLAPYDLKLDDLTAQERRDWGRRVVFAIESQFLQATGVNFKERQVDLMVLAGKTYVDAIRQHESPWIGAIREPLAGMMIGERLQFLSQARAG